MGADKTSRAVELEVDGKLRVFDIDDPKLPDWVDDNTFASDNYPYKKKLDRDEYEDTLKALQIELVKVQTWLGETGNRVISVFEGRDAAARAALSAPHGLT